MPQLTGVEIGNADVFLEVRPEFLVARFCEQFAFVVGDDESGGLVVCAKNLHQSIRYGNMSVGVFYIV